MLIEHDGKLKYDDIQSSEKVMEATTRTCEMREQGALEMKEKVFKQLMDARRAIQVLHRERAKKEHAIEQTECRYKETERRFNVVEARTQQTIKDTRLDQMAYEKEMKIRTETKMSMEKQSTYHGKILNCMQRAEVLEKQLHHAFDKESRIRDRIHSQNDCLIYYLSREDELKNGIRKKVINIKQLHGAVFDLEPKLRDSFTRMEAGEAKVAEMKLKVKAKEEEVKKMEGDIKQMSEDIRRLTIESVQKHKRKAKKADTISALGKFSRFKTPIDCYRLKNKPDIIKAFEKFTECYGAR